jgi:parallel beta-helix repeat protein
MKHFYKFLGLFLFALNVYAQPTYYVDYTAGLDTYPGTEAQPFKTLAKGVTTLGANLGTIYLRGGIHQSIKVSLSRNIPPGYINIWAYPGEKPVIDFSTATSGNDGFGITGSYYHIKGIEFIKAPHCGIRITTGSNNIVENCVFRANGNTGLSIGSSSTTLASNNLIYNCDACFNFNSPGGADADGFAAKANVGTGNVYRGCRSYNNSDDGFDLYGCTASIIIDSCFAFRNGVDSWGTSRGNGNGFKLGGNYVPASNTVTNCVAFDNFCASNNGGKGFDENHNTAGQTIYNCTSFRNTYPNFSFPDDPLVSGTHIIRNCISYQGLQPDVIINAIEDHNSWDGFTVTDADFVSLDTAQARAPRNPDGSLPAITLFHLANSRPMVNAGIDVGIPFNDSAPDLGAFETPPGSVPVELTSFFANVEKYNVLLGWNTATEVNNYGFDIERRMVPSGTWQKIGFVAGAGTSNSPISYAYADKNVVSGRYAYRLKQIDGNGSFKYSQSVEVQVGTLPTVFALGQNYPNPFNPSTVINFSVAKAGFAKLHVINILGQQIATLFSGNAEPGTIYPIQFNAPSLPSGVYLSVLESNGKQEVKKMLLMK